MSGKAIIDSIAKNAERLVGENRKLRNELARSETAREKLREENRRLAAENAGLERRLIVKELAAGFAGHGAKIARARVNRLMREVDKCTALLNRE